MCVVKIRKLLHLCARFCWVLRFDGFLFLQELSTEDRSVQQSRAFFITRGGGMV